MTFNWQEFFTMLGGQTIFLGAAAYLIKQLISSRLERDADAFKAKLQRDADIEIERLKNALQIAALEHQVRFTKLHEQRVEIISQLSREIVEVPAVVADYVINNVRDNESLGRAINRAAGLYSLIQNNRIVLPSSVCALLDEFSNKLTKIVTFVSVYWWGFR